MLGGSSFEAAFMYAAAIVVARLLGPDNFGIFQLGVSAIGLNVILYELGLPTAILRYVAIYDGENDAARAKGTAVGGAVLCGGLGLIGAAVLALLADPIARGIFHKPALAPILPIMALQLPALGAMAALLRATQARGTMRYRVLVEKIAVPVSRLVLIVLLVVLGTGLVGAAWGASLGCVVGLGLALLFAGRMARKAWGSARPRPELRQLVSYAFPLMLVSIALYARNRGITLALGVVGSSAQVGVFAAADRTAIVAGMGLNAVGAIFAPFAADLYNRQEHAELHRILKKAAAWIVMAVLPVELFLVVCAPQVMSTFGKGFLEGYVCLMILAGAQVISCLFGSVNILLAMCGKQWLMLVDLVLFALISIGLGSILVPRMGVIGGAIAAAIGILGPRVTRLIEVAVLMRMSPFGVGHLKVAACAMVPIGLMLAWRELFPGTLAHPLFLPAAVPLYLLLYVATLQLGAREELGELVAILKQRRTRASREPAGDETGPATALSEPVVDEPGPDDIGG